LGEFVSQVESDAPPMPWNRFQFAIDDAPPRTETGNGPEETIRFSGELDLASAADLQAAIQEARHHGTSWLKLDLREVTFIDSVGLSLLVTAYNRLTEEGGRLHLEMSARLRPLLDLSGLLEILD